jgi:hypothetical protein
MKKAIPTESHQTIKDLFLLSSGSMKGIMIGLTVGTVATAILQSSGVTVSILVMLASQGMVGDLKEAIPLDPWLQYRNLRNSAHCEHWY